jgi:hypothetical protein
MLSSSKVSTGSIVAKWVKSGTGTVLLRALLLPILQCVRRRRRLLALALVTRIELAAREIVGV